MIDMHDQETTPAAGPPMVAPTHPLTGVLAEGGGHSVEGHYIPAAPDTWWVEDTDNETEWNETHAPAAPQGQARGDESAPETPLADQPVPDDLLIDDWIEDSDPDLELASARTVGEVRLAIGEWFSSLPDYHWFWPLVFAAKDGKVYTAEVGAVVRLATPDEVGGAVENAKERERDMAELLMDRIKALDGYAKKSGA